MSAGSNLRSEDLFQCSICLDLFTDPVSTPCGHNFCKTCISQHWNSSSSCLCPVCKKMFQTRPVLEVNTLLRELVDQLRHESQQAAVPVEVLCDFCTGTKLKALKSCLVCLASYCQTHLESHLTASRLKRHQLLDPVKKLEEMICLKHDKPLELFCKTDQTCVCMLCSVLDHNTHEFVPLTEEYEEKKAELRNTEDEVQQMIHNRWLKIQKIEDLLKISKAAADRQKAEGLQVFTDLMDSVERNKKSFMKEVEDKQKTTEKQARGFIKDLGQEISELMKRNSEVKQLSRSGGPRHLLQNFSSLKAVPPTRDWNQVRVHLPSYEGILVRALTQLEEDIRNKKMMKKMSEAELKRVKTFEVDLTLDSEITHPFLVLSDDGKQVHCGDVWEDLLDNPERFSECACVLGTRSFSSGKFYFQVQVKGKTDWDLGVVRKSINRKGFITANPQNGFWSIVLRNGNEYKAFSGPPVRLCLQSGPENVGVFVDYQEGLVSFHDVDTAALIYSFTGCCFTEELYPYFSPNPNEGGKNLTPLIIRPVNQSA